MVLLMDHGRPDLAGAAAQAGVLSCLLKPVDQRLLEPCLRLALANFKRRQELIGQAREMQEGLATRKLVERAKGMLMDGLGLSETEALNRLQHEAVQRGLTLAEAARVLLEADRLTDSPAPPKLTLGE